MLAGGRSTPSAGSMLGSRDPGIGGVDAAAGAPAAASRLSVASARELSGALAPVAVFRSRPLQDKTSAMHESSNSLINFWTVCSGIAVRGSSSRAPGRRRVRREHTATSGRTVEVIGAVGPSNIGALGRGAVRGLESYRRASRQTQPRQGVPSVASPASEPLGTEELMSSRVKTRPTRTTLPALTLTSLPLAIATPSTSVG
jgi:hypothetical protein